MTKIPFQRLPDAPDLISGKHVLIRILDAIGFRYQLATKGLTTKEYHFRPVEGSMNMLELMDHMYKVLFFAYNAFDSSAKRLTPQDVPGFREATLGLCQSFKEILSQLTEEQINKTTVYLKRNDTTYSFWYLINGPLADVLTHIGQINSWRRIAGNPVERISPFTGQPF